MVRHLTLLWGHFWTWLEHEFPKSGQFFALHEEKRFGMGSCRHKKHQMHKEKDSVCVRVLLNNNDILDNSPKDHFVFSSRVSYIQVTKTFGITSTELVNIIGNHAEKFI